MCGRSVTATNEYCCTITLIIFLLVKFIVGLSLREQFMLHSVITIIRNNYTDTHWLLYSNNIVEIKNTRKAEVIAFWMTIIAYFNPIYYFCTTKSLTRIFGFMYFIISVDWCVYTINDQKNNLIQDAPCALTTQESAVDWFNSIWNERQKKTATVFILEVDFAFVVVAVAVVIIIIINQ